MIDSAIKTLSELIDNLKNNWSVIALLVILGVLVNARFNNIEKTLNAVKEDLVVTKVCMKAYDSMFDDIDDDVITLKVVDKANDKRIDNHETRITVLEKLGD